VAHAEQLRREYQLPMAVFGHAGDGNFHVNPMKPPSMTPEEWYAQVDLLQQDLYRRVKELGGTISGEHGIGRKRAERLPLALSPPEIAAMRAIKRALDPLNVLNPGVIFPA
jgi:glycolate oxidase